MICDRANIHDLVDRLDRLDLHDILPFSTLSAAQILNLILNT